MGEESKVKKAYLREYGRDMKTSSRIKNMHKQMTEPNVAELAMERWAIEVADLEAENEALRKYTLGLMANSYRGMGKEQRELILESELIALLAK